MVDEVRINNKLVLKPAWDHVADKFMNHWRNGELGCSLLDRQYVDYYFKEAVDIG